MLVIKTEEIATQTIMVTFKENKFLGCYKLTEIYNQTLATSGDICISNQKLHGYMTLMNIQVTLSGDIHVFNQRLHEYVTPFS